MRPISAAKSGEVGRNRGQGDGGNPVAGTEREEEKGGQRVDWSVGCDRATRSGSTRWAGARQVGQGPDRWARGLTGGPGEVLNQKTNKRNTKK
jgi:hypothetical protein